MTLQTFLKGKDKGLEVRVVHQINIDDTLSHMVLGGKVEKPHLFDVIRWKVEINNYKPLVVVYVK
jgi:hypothetical protein